LSPGGKRRPAAAEEITPLRDFIQLFLFPWPNKELPMEKSHQNKVLKMAQQQRKSIKTSSLWLFRGSSTRRDGGKKRVLKFLFYSSSQTDAFVAEECEACKSH
jgi:hypothetical protein